MSGFWALPAQKGLLLPPSVGALFERAFRCADDDTKGRPTPVEWVQELDALSQALVLAIE